MSATSTEHPGRNEPCHCGSGKKYKHCCLHADAAADREKQAAAQAESEPAPAKGKAASEGYKPHHKAEQPWKRDADNRQPFQRFLKPPKRGG